MSGIEVAGLVLGAFPVAIWALEQYRDVARVMGFWYEIRLEYQRSSNELKFHRLSFLRNLKQLLLPIVQDDAQLQRLVGDPGGDAWKEPGIQSALEARLHDSYHLYLEILGEMQRVMQDLKEELAIDSDIIQSNAADERRVRTKPSATSRIKQSFDRSNRSYQAFRVKFSVGERARTRLFAEFQTYNDRLEKLMASSDAVSELEEARQNQQVSSKSTTAAITKFWGNADKLYKALLGAWNCGCRDRHCAQLMLQHRAPADNDFRLQLDSGAEERSNDGVWSMCSLTIRTLEQVSQNLAAFGQLSIQEREVDVSVATTTQQRHTKPVSKSVRFGASQEQKTVLATGPAATTRKMKQAHIASAKHPLPPSIIPALPPSPPPSIHTPVDTLNIITDLCHALDIEAPSTSSKNSDPLGYLAPADSNIRFAIHPNPVTPAQHPHISLASLIFGSEKPPLTRRQRYRLSLVLASSFVQLKDTAWLQMSWDKRCVYFHTSTPGPGIPSLDSPFIITQFDQNLPSIHDGPWTGSTPVGGHDVAGIACLGILLLELCFGRAIEHHPSRLVLPGGIGEEQMRAALDLIAALEWLKDVNDEAGADYTEAVEWCLARCRTLPSDGSWRKLMVEKVVEPLERCYKYLG